MQPLVSLVDSINALDPALHWTNLETIVTRTYSTRSTAVSTLDVRLLTSATTLDRPGVDGEIRFVKSEPVADLGFVTFLAGHAVKNHRQGADLIFRQATGATGPMTVDVRVSPSPPLPLPPCRLTYRGKVAVRRYLSEIRDNYVAKNSFAMAALASVRAALNGSALVTR
jgi:hypothetical protein